MAPLPALPKFLAGSLIGVGLRHHETLQVVTIVIVCAHRTRNLSVETFWMDADSGIVASQEW